MAEKTMEQDWEDRFPFLKKTSGLEAPFLLALCHARSRRHLERMLREWLPPNWRVCNSDLVAMQLHWSAWYEPHRGHVSGGTSDHLVRSAITRMTRMTHVEYGLHEYYRTLIQQSRPKWNFSEWVESVLQRPYLKFDCSGEFSSSFAVEVRDCKMSVSVHILWNDTGQRIWRASIDAGRELTEETTHILCGLPQGLGWSRSGLSSVMTLQFPLNGSLLDELSSVEWIMEPVPLSHVTTKSGLYEEIVRQLSALGVPVVRVE